ncbi:MAG: hypothetical protein PHT88_03995 [Candidatus Moranbacteria bacterium]|nr:hypothetical protein [Candidatus Moranbacteria bacterium]
MILISPLFFGLLTAAGALVAELFIFSFFIQDPAVYSTARTNANFVFATGGITFLSLSALIEECSKYALLRQTLPPEASFLRTLLFLILFSIGFSGLEITLLILGNPLINTAATLHIGGVFLIHLTTISLFGYALSHRSLRKFSALFIPAAFLVHFLYNVAILYKDTLHV